MARDKVLGAATYTFLLSGDLPRAVELTAESGVRLIELTTAPPQVDRGELDPSLVRRVRAAFDATGTRPLSLNPTYLDVNLVSLNTGFRQESLSQLLASLQACHDLEIPMLVLFPGRRHVLAPAPFEVSRRVLLDELDVLLTHADRLGVVIGLENGPTNFLDRAAQVAAVCAEVDRPSLRIVYDVANAQMVEDPAAGVADVLPYLALVHVSDTSRVRWAHARVGLGDVDFGAIAAALDAAPYDGPSLMEIVDLDDPLGALASSVEALRRWGWRP